VGRAALRVRFLVAVAQAFAPHGTVVGIGSLRLRCLYAAGAAAGACSGESCQSQYCEYAHDNLLVVLLKLIVRSRALAARERRRCFVWKGLSGGRVRHGPLVF